MWMYACDAALPWITQAWELEWGKRVRGGGGRGKNNLWIYFDLSEKDLMMFWGLPTASCSILHTSLGWWASAVLWLQSLATACLGHRWGAGMWEGWGKKKVLCKFPSCCIRLAGKPPGKVVAEPSAWIQNRMFHLIGERKKKPKPNPNQKRSYASVLFYPLNYINTNSKGALQAFAGIKTSYGLVFLMQPKNFGTKECVVASVIPWLFFPAPYSLLGDHYMQTILNNFDENGRCQFAEKNYPVHQNCVPYLEKGKTKRLETPCFLWQTIFRFYCWEEMRNKHNPYIKILLWLQAHMLNPKLFFHGGGE